MATNEELVAVIQQGDRDRLPELWEQVRRFAWRMADRAAQTHEDAEDFYQSGFIALDHAVRSFKADGGSSFIGWYAYSLKNAFAEAGGYRTKRQACDPLRHAMSLDAPLSAGDPDGAVLADVLPTRYDDLQISIRDAEQDALYSALRRAVDTLPDAERSVIVARYWHGLTLQEVAERRGVGKEWIRQVEARALRRLRHPAVNREIRSWL